MDGKKLNGLKKKMPQLRPSDVAATTVKYKLVERAARSQLPLSGRPHNRVEVVCFRNEVFKGSFGCEWKEVLMRFLRVPWNANLKPHPAVSVSVIKVDY